MYTTINELLDRFELQQSELLFDGEFHALSKESLKGWYIGRASEQGKSAIRILTIGDWRTGEIYRAREGGPKTKRELEALTQAQLAEIEAKRRKANDLAANSCRAEWDAIVSQPISTSAYAVKKRIGNLYGAKVAKTQHGQPVLCIPMRDMEGKIWGIQRIFDDGAKYFSDGQRIEGVFHAIGTYTPGAPVLLCEGFATGATLHKATGLYTLCALSASNLAPVAEELRRVLPKEKILVCGDDDRFQAKNIGRVKAVTAARNASASLVFPQFKDGLKRNTDFNDLEIEEGLPAVQGQVLGVKALAPEEVLPTEHTGFHEIEFKNGEEVYTPNIHDLCAFYARKNHYVVLSRSERILTWSGTHFVDTPPLEIESFAETHFNPKPNSFTVSEFVKKVSRTSLCNETKFQDKSRHHVNLRNGVLDTRTLSLSAHSPEFGFSSVLNYDYDPQAKCPNFEALLSRMFPNDPDLRLTVLEFIGYALSGDEYWAHKALILEGAGANGKSTLLDIIRALIGRENVTSFGLAALKEPTNAAMLYGKLANIAEETPSQKLVTAEQFKLLTSGGDVMARNLYERPFSMQSYAKIMLACNELPDSFDSSQGFFRRLIIVPCRAVFDPSQPDFDPHIKEKIMGEFPGIFNLAMEKYLAAKKRKKLTESKSADEEREDYMEEVDYIATWVKTHLVVHPLGNGHDSHIERVSEIYQEFAMYAERYGYPKTSKTRFSQKLKHAVPDLKTRKVVARDKQLGRAIRGIKGVELLRKSEF
jgi:P4 family phage/plasmid primase-like protien